MLSEQGKLIVTQLRSKGMDDNAIKQELLKMGAKPAAPTTTTPTAPINNYDPNADTRRLGKISGPVRVASDVARGIGLGLIPSAAGSLYELGRFGAEGLGNVLGVDKKVLNKIGTTQNPFVSEQQFKKEATLPGAAESALRNTAGAYAWALPSGRALQPLSKFSLPMAKAITGVGRGILGTASQPGTGPKEMAIGGTFGGIMEPLLAYSTFKKLGNMTRSAADKATAKGGGVHWDKVSKEIRDKAFKELGDVPEVRDAVNKLLMPEVPAGVESLPSTMLKTPSDLLTLRTQIRNREGSNIFNMITKSSDVPGKVAKYARDVISKNLHQLAPETKIPDYVVRAYNWGGVMKGDIPTKLQKIIGVEILRRTIGPYASSIIRGVTTGQ